ncbi:MAG: serine/threonine protein kinase, partial [Planctomycetota bacterium]|nr:serine/threonine protein kinase [Planctomycetota bacterium]
DPDISLSLFTEGRRFLIPGYEIPGAIGSGTIATVYKAIRLSDGREAALKALRPELAKHPHFVQAYLNEAGAVSRFHHPNIVQAFDIGEANGIYYYAEELLSGGSLADRIRNGGPDFSEAALLLFLRQTVAALRHAWEAAVYHGDINPSNLRLDANGDIKLANLGVPRVATPSHGSGSIPDFVRGSLKYAAPEQLDNPELVNARTDIYSLGATFYHVSFGTPPFSGDGEAQLLDNRRDRPMPSFSLKCQDRFSNKYLRLLHQMLAVNPGERPADPEALSLQLERFHQGADSSVIWPEQASRRLFFDPACLAPASAGRDRVFSLKPRVPAKKGTAGQAAALLLVLAAAAACLLWLC